MFELHLRLYRRRGLIGLEFPWGGRVGSLALAVLLTAAAFVGGPPAPLGLGLAVLFLIGSLYDEQWAFDVAARHVYFRLGVIGLGRTRRWDFDDVELVLGAFRRGSLPSSNQSDTPSPFRRGRPAFAVLRARWADGSTRVIERRPARRKSELEAVAQTLADATGLRLSRDESW